MTQTTLRMPVRVTAKDIYLNILIYGPAGSGKTSWAAQAQSHSMLGPVLFLNVEGGLLSVAGRGDIDMVEVQTAEELEAYFWALRNKAPGFEHYRTVVIDSITALQDRFLQQIVRMAINANPGKAARDARSIDDIYIEDYGKSTAQLKRLLGWFRDLQMHVIFTALPKAAYPKGADPKKVAPTEVKPFLTDKLSDSVQGYMDFVWYYYKDDGGQRHILTNDYAGYKAKTRGPNFAQSLGQVFNDPFLPNIYDLLIQCETTNMPVNVAPPMFSSGEPVRMVLPNSPEVTPIAVSTPEAVVQDEPADEGIEGVSTANETADIVGGQVVTTPTFEAMPIPSDEFTAG